MIRSAIPTTARTDGRGTAGVSWFGVDMGVR